MEQSFVFKESDVGPFYMTEKERKARRYDVQKNKKKRSMKTKAELRDEMLKKSTAVNIRGSAEQLQERALLMGLTVEKYEDNIIEGWVGKPKGMKQVAFERGLIDLDNVNLYTKVGQTDSDGKVIDDSFSLKLMISTLTDFVEEETLLQYMTKKIGQGLGLSVIVDRSPKCHPEVAGEGIEYSWANSKIYLRGLPIEQRRSKKKFNEKVRLAVSTNEGANLNKEKVRKFSARARDFIVAYHILHSSQHNNSTGNVQVTSLAKEDIIKARKRYRSHRGVERQQLGWCVKNCEQMNKKLKVSSEMK